MLGMKFQMGMSFNLQKALVDAHVALKLSILCTAIDGDFQMPHQIVKPICIVVRHTLCMVVPKWNASLRMIVLQRWHHMLRNRRVRRMSHGVSLVALHELVNLYMMWSSPVRAYPSIISCGMYCRVLRPCVSLSRLNCCQALATVGHSMNA